MRTELGIKRRLARVYAELDTLRRGSSPRALGRNSRYHGLLEQRDILEWVLGGRVE